MSLRASSPAGRSRSLPRRSCSRSFVGRLSLESDCSTPRRGRVTACDRLVRRTRLRHRLAILFTLAVVGCGMGRRGVVRLVDGREIEGRLIGEEAYALYARAAVLEASGQEP